MYAYRDFAHENSLRVWELFGPRTQVLLEDSQHRALLSLSRRTGRGISELIRGAIDRLLGAEDPASSRKLAVMRRLRLSGAVSTDRHFRQAGFDVLT